MKKFWTFKKERTIVVTDANARIDIRNICRHVDYFTRKRIDTTISHAHGENGEMRIIRYYASKRTARKLQQLLEACYPGLCVFNP